MKKTTFGLSLALVLVCGAGAFAQDEDPVSDNKWHSLFGSTHKKIAKEAINRINKGAYPDIEAAKDELRSGAASESGHADFWRDNGGNPKALWGNGDKKNQGGVLGNYKALNPEAAYHALGVICHLTQDMTVPAHAANIKHLSSEALEEYADFAGKIGQVPEIASSKLPYEYYQIAQDETRSRLSSWLNPDTGRQFWLPSPLAPKLGQDTTFGPRGDYGGGKDTYAFWQGGSNNGHGAASNRIMITRFPEICSERLGTAAGYTKAVMESASRLLPPLVKDLEVYPNVVTPGGKVKISFTALDNRTRDIRCSVRVTGPGGQEVYRVEGMAALEKIKPAPFNSSNNDSSAVVELFPESFMLNRRLSVELDGRKLTEGKYTVEVQLTDEDGNTIPADVNADSVRENNSRTGLSVVNVIPESPSSPAW